MESLKGLQALGQHVAEEQDASLQATDLSEMREQLLDALPSPDVVRLRKNPGKWAARVGVGVAAAVAVAALGFVALNFAEPNQLQRLRVTVAGQPVDDDALDNWWSAPPDTALPIEFSDGTKLDLEAKSRARLLQVTENGAHIVLESGTSSVDVVPRESSNWQVSAGPFLVHVVGTSFDLEWGPDDDLFVLTLHKGKVNLSGCVFGGGRSVVAGETVRASCKSRQYEIATRDSKAVETADAAQQPGEPAASSEQLDSTPPPTAQAVARAPSWRSLARAGKYKEALDAANSAGFSDTLTRASAEELALLGDAARYSNRPDQAVQAYQKLRSRFPGTARASTAAYSLARTHFDQRGSFGEAARWFQVYLKERPSGALAREAEGRLIESLNRSGNRQAAEHRAESYLRRYPTGPHAALARSLTRKNARETR